MCLLAIFMSSWEKYVFRSSHFLIVFFCVLWSCMSCLSIFEIKPMSVASFGNIFYHSVGCLFVSFCFLFLFCFVFNAFFAVQKVCMFDEVPFCLFLFLTITLGDSPKKTYVWYVRKCFAFVLF